MFIITLERTASNAFDMIIDFMIVRFIFFHQEFRISRNSELTAIVSQDHSDAVRHLFNRCPEKLNWGKKVYELRVSDHQIGFSLDSQGVTQAMMIIDISKKCKHWLQSNEILVYIEFIQSAPWNNRHLNDCNVRYGGTGTILMRKAV